jgi:hypothetical protein
LKNIGIIRYKYFNYGQRLILTKDLNIAARRSFDNAHGRCAPGSKKIAESEVKIVPLADSSWIKLKKKVFLFLFFQKKKCHRKKISQ